MDCAIQLLSGGHLDGALRLSSTAGWNQRVEDWRMLVSLAPAASFAAVHEGQVVGTAIGIDYERFSWIAMMLVDPAYRGHGIGRRLLQAAMDAVPGDRPIRLDATPMGRPLYQSHGFEDEAQLTRHAAGAGETTPIDGASRRHVQPLTTGNLDGVLAADDAVFRGARRGVLRWALEGAPHYARLLQSTDGVSQYCFGRLGRLFDQIGPVVAVETGAACAVAGAAISASTGRPLVIDAFDERKEFGAWLRACGFASQRPLFRMQRPPMRGTVQRPGTHTPLHEFAILGPEFA